MSNYAGKSVTLGHSASGVTGSYTAVGMVTDLNPPGLVTNFAEATHRGSITGSSGSLVEEFVPTTNMWDAITFELTFDPANTTQNHSAGLLSYQRAQTREYWNFVFPDASEWYVEAYVAKFQPKAGLKDALKADVELKPSGDIGFSS